MTFPNFLIIGAQKAGTTSIYEYLSQHPDVFMSSVKEPHFFTYLHGTEFTNGDYSRFFRADATVTDVAAYEALFADAGRKRAIGEASPSYIYSADAPRNIADMIPDGKIIAIVRNPVDRAFSNYQMNWRLGQETLPTFEAAIDAEEQRIKDKWGYAWHYVNKGFYSLQIQRYRDLIPSDQILVLFYDDLVGSPEAFMRSIYTFLNIDTTFTADMSASSNVSGVPRNMLLAQLFRPVMMTRKTWGPLMPDVVRHQLRKRLLTKSRMLPETRQRLIATYRDDILALQTVTGRDLSRWLS